MLSSSRDPCEGLTAVVRLIPAEMHLMDAALAGSTRSQCALGHDVAAGRATFTEALRPTGDALGTLETNRKELGFGSMLALR